ncbi:MAG: DMT family transporter [Sandaracinaceae bacterium]|nr:MAG: DMT family transporter [Sandaracinaceae bacterium]
MRRGPLFMILAGLLFTVMLGLVKVAREELSALEVVCWRSVTALPLSFVLARRAGIAVKSRRTLLVRCVLGFGAVFGFFTAAKGLTMAQLSLVSKLQPILIAVLAPLALGVSEKSDKSVWVVLGLGLAGSALLLSPDLSSGSIYGLLALFAAVSSAGAHVAVRALGKTDNPFALVFWFQLFLCVAAVAAFVATERTLLPLPPAHLWWTLVGVGVSTTLAQLAMTRAYQLDKASTVAAASYAGPLFAVVGDILFFAAWPDAWALGGGALIVLAGAWLVFSPRQAP